MRTLGLTATEWEAYLAALSTTHQRRIVVEVQTLSGVPLRSLTPLILDGQVTGDTSAEVMTVLSLQVLDPARSLGFEPDSASALPLHRSRALKVRYDVRVPALGRWVECQVFGGPIWDMTREGAVVTLTAHGWERQALGEKWAPKGFAKKSRRTTAIRSLMTAAGETNMSVPDLLATFPARTIVKRLDKVWPKARAFAHSTDRVLFYDPAEKLWLRRVSTKPVVTFDGRWLVSQPKLERKVDDLRNVFEVWGVKPKGAKTRPHVAIPIRGDLSPTGLGRNGKPHYLAHSEENPHLKTRAECLALAVRRRDEQARGTVGVSIEVLPFPPLDLYDLVHAVTDEGTQSVRAASYTLPLGGSEPGGGQGQPMVIGQVRRTMSAAPRRRP